MDRSALAARSALGKFILNAVQVMWIYLLGPFVALLPRHWRDALPFTASIRWRSATIVSGIVESILALVALMNWYWYSMSTSLSHLADLALTGKTATGTTDHHLGFAALLVWSTHPLTWLISFFGIEGMVRTCGALTDSVLGVFPLYLVDKVFAILSQRKEPEALGAPKFAQSNFSSYVGTMREKVVTARLSQVADEHCVIKCEAEEFLEIRACRAKPEWTPPRVVRYQDRYYRLEESFRKSGARPFIYKLRRLAAGVPGRTVLLYSPEEEPVIASR